MPLVRGAAVVLVVTLLAAGPGRAGAEPPAAPPASQPASQPAVRPPAPPVPAAAVAAPAPAPAPAAPASLAVAADKGWFVPGILAQVWFQLDRYSGNETVGKDYTTSTFKLRRMELSAKGEILKGRFGYGVMIDPAKILEPVSKSYTDSNGDTVSVPTAPKAINVLQDVWVSLLTDYADVAVGQFKIPVSWEALAPSSALLFPERSIVTLQWGDKRDIGAKVSKTFKYVGYYLGLFNGQGANNLDTNNSKDLAGRLEVYPIRGLTVAGMVYHELKASSTVYQKRRYEADLRFERWGFLFQGEYIRGTDQAPTDKAAKTGQGFYTTLAYVFLGGRLQPAVRLGLLDPDLSKGKDYTTFYEAGVNWYLYKTYAKLQLAYSRFQLPEASGKKCTNEVILAAQGHY